MPHERLEARSRTQDVRSLGAWWGSLLQSKRWARSGLPYETAILLAVGFGDHEYLKNSDHEFGIPPYLSRTIQAQAGGGGDESSPQQQLARLRFFMEHVKRTLEKMEQAKHGLHHYTSQQLDMLEVRSGPQNPGSFVWVEFGLVFWDDVG